MAEFNPEWLSQVPEPPYDDQEFSSQSENTIFREGLRRLEDSGQSDLRNVWYWTTRLNSAQPQASEFLTSVRFISRVAVGFLEEFDGAFGIIAYAESPQDPAADKPFDEDVGARRSTSVLVDGREFPLLVRQTFVELHWYGAPTVVDPSDARATAWVRSPTRNYEGWLIPRHAVRSVRSRVRFSDGGAGTVIDHFGQCIDAVVVSSDSPPSGLTPAPACWPLVAGRALEVIDSVNGHVPLSILDVDLNLGILSDVVFPIRFSTDWSGAAGQSGALMVDPVRGEPAGAYLGVTRPSVAGYLPPGTSTRPLTAGYAQSCFQLEKIAGMEFYL